MDKRDVVIVSGSRTAIGSLGGGLKDITAVKLGSIVIKDALVRAGLRPIVTKETLDYGPDALKRDGLTDLEKKHSDWDSTLNEVEVDEVIMGNVLQSAQGQNPGRQATVYAGLPKETPAFTVSKVCASGLKAIVLGAQSIMTGNADVVIAGGMESMSCTPYALPKARWGYRMDVTSRGEMLDLMVFDGLWETFYGYHMGNTAENIAERYGITRQEQDEVGLLSHQRAMAAIKGGIFSEEIVPVPIPQRKGDPVMFETDERPMETSLEKMGKLAPAFKKGGVVTAGNSSGINDASAAVVLMSKEKAKAMGLEPIVTIRSFATGAIDPAYMGLGPIPAIRKAVKKAGITVNDLNLIELNEAFASQVIACMRELNMSWDNTNPVGSGISLGHPIGCTGARITVTAMNQMKRNNLRYGLITMCIGGGQGMAMVVER